jgi:hypothetical protein
VYTLTVDVHRLHSFSQQENNPASTGNRSYVDYNSGIFLKKVDAFLFQTNEVWKFQTLEALFKSGICISCCPGKLSVTTQ